MTRAGSLQAISSALAGVMIALAGCGGGQTRGEAFDRSWSDRGAQEARAFEEAFRATPIPRGVDVAVGVTEGDTLIGAPLDGSATWTYRHELDSRPAVAGTVVVGLGAGELFALDAEKGALLWRRRTGGLLRGVGDDGKITVVSLVPLTGHGSIVLAIAHDGQVVRQIEDDAAIGEPAVIDGYAFLPWQGQYVTIFDLLDGEERARMEIRSLTSRAFTVGGALFFGELRVTRFDERIGFAPLGRASMVALPERALPGRPLWMRSGTEVPPLYAVASDKVKLYARPAAKGPLAIVGGRYAATYYRVALGLDASSGKLRWAHTHDAEFIGGAAAEGGFALCDRTGRVWFFDAESGAAAASVSLGRAIDTCVVQVDRLEVPRAPAASSLAEELAEVALLPGPLLGAIRHMALDELIALGGDTTVRTLITLIEDDDAPPELRAKARRALAAQKNGARAMLDALARRYDYIKGVLRPPPVGLLSDALAGMGETRASPLLASYLGDPTLAPDDVRRAARALVSLAGPSELEPLRVFFAQYRGVAPPEVDPAMLEAVVASARALVKLGAIDVVREASEDAFTTAALKPELRKVLRALPRAP